jgi:hypothetical protein
VADVGARVDVVDRGGEIELLVCLRHGLAYFKSSSAGAGFAGQAFAVEKRIFPLRPCGL